MLSNDGALSATADSGANMMSDEIAGRESELRSVTDFVASVNSEASALILHGEAGIGKTILWEAGVAEAGLRGFQVLRCRPVESEARLSYAALADLLAEADDDILGRLPAAQRHALDVALLRGPPGAAAPDQRSVAAALIAVLHQLSRAVPVLVAVDDIQWLDDPSGRALEFAARRLSGPIGILIAARTGGLGAGGLGAGSLAASDMRAGVAGGRSRDGSELRLPNPARIARMEIGPLSLSALQQVLLRRAGMAFSRPTLARILETSGGNPFFALELARVLGSGSARAPGSAFPATLTDVVRDRLDRVGGAAREILLAAAALAIPRVDTLAGIDPAAAALLEDAEELGVIAIDGYRVRFSHPILASGIYALATPAQRRAVHRRLAGAGLDAEERARHLALAAMRADHETIAALDTAAAHARSRGAPAAAADLLELAFLLGADDPARKIAAAAHHFDAGDPARARSLLEETIDVLPPGTVRAEAQRLLATVRLHDDSYLEASALLEQALAEAGEEPVLRVRIHLELLYVLTNLGRISQAVLHVEPVIDDAERSGDSSLIAHALAASTITRFLNGQGLDERRLQRALDLEDTDQATAVMFRPTMMAALLWMWTGQLGRAREALYSLRRECLDRGEETDLMFVAFHTVMLECWRGDLVSARQVADDAHQRALQLGTDVPLAIALSTVANIAAHAGNATQAREAATAALAIFQRGSCLVATLWPLAALGFLEFSLDAFEAAADLLAPMAAGAASMGVLEPACIPFAADAAEALIALGRTQEATVLVDQLEVHGRRLDRAWALATGGRCRALLLAAKGDTAAAIEVAEAALAQHERLIMPIERARTLLTLGRLQRRQGKRKASRATLEAALRVFEEIGAALWVDKARTELRRTGLQPGPGTELTPTEQRVAELAASGRTNREVAAFLLISPKTVEANLARIYKKLQIRSRAELGRLMADTGRNGRPDRPGGSDT